MRLRWVIRQQFSHAALWGLWRVGCKWDSVWRWRLKWCLIDHNAYLHFIFLSPQLLLLFLNSLYLVSAETKANSCRSICFPGIFFTALGWSLWIYNRRTIKASFLMRCFDRDGLQCHSYHTYATAGQWFISVWYPSNRGLHTRLRGHNCLCKSRVIRDAEKKRSGKQWKGPPTLCSQISCPAWLRVQKYPNVFCSVLLKTMNQ